MKVCFSEVTMPCTAKDTLCAVEGIVSDFDFLIVTTDIFFLSGNGVPLNDWIQFRAVPDRATGYNVVLRNMKDLKNIRSDGFVADEYNVVLRMKRTQQRSYFFVIVFNPCKLCAPFFGADISEKERRLFYFFVKAPDSAIVFFFYGRKLFRQRAIFGKVVEEINAVVRIAVMVPVFRILTQKLRRKKIGKMGTDCGDDPLKIGDNPIKRGRKVA